MAGEAKHLSKLGSHWPAFIFQFLPINRVFSPLGNVRAASREHWNWARVTFRTSGSRKSFSKPNIQLSRYSFLFRFRIVLTFYIKGLYPSESQMFLDPPTQSAVCRGAQSRLCSQAMGQRIRHSCPSLGARPHDMESLPPPRSCPLDQLLLLQAQQCDNCKSVIAVGSMKIILIAESGTQSPALGGRNDGELISLMPSFYLNFLAAKFYSELGTIHPPEDS
jgi:hypothetical protein